MILAEKIVKLRKGRGWSQEELAEQLDISRQSVSKWEGGLSVPELDKIIRMSEIFGVTTDYLLKEEDLNREWEAGGENKHIPVDDHHNKENQPTGRHVSLEEAENFMEVTKKVSRWIALSVFMCIISPICMIALSGLSEYGMIPLTEDMAASVGMVILLVFVAPAVAVMVFQGLRLSKYEYIEKETLFLEAGIAEQVKEKEEIFESSFRTGVMIGIFLCIGGVIPVFVAGIFETPVLAISSIGILLFLVACSVYLFIRVGMIKGSYQKLLQEGDYSEKNKKASKILTVFSGVYWCAVTAVFLTVFFRTEDGKGAGLIWPVAGVLFAALYLLVKGIVTAREEK